VQGWLIVGVVPLKLTGILNIAYRNENTVQTVTAFSFDAVQNSRLTPIFRRQLMLPSSALKEFGLK
jgi:hypothetical protein